MRIKVVVLQPTSLCNLDCVYCYLPDRQRASTMAEPLLDRVLERVLASPLVRGEVELLWHAGEPLAVGLPYYERAVELVERHNHRGVRVRLSVQTNATLVDDAWAAFLRRYRFRVGVSVDGPAALHDRQRVRWSGGGTHAAVMRGVETLRRHGIDPGVICVLTRASLERPDEVFDFFLEHGFRSVAFNVEEVENLHRSSSLQFADVVPAYQRFIARVYDRWRPYRHRMHIRELDDLGRAFAAYRADPGWYRPAIDTEPLSMLIVQHNGNLSTFSPELASAVAPGFGDFVIGNMWALDSLDDLVTSERFQRVAAEVEASQAMCRESCAFFALCGGEYLSNKVSENGTLRSTETTACRLHRQALATVLLDKLSPAGAG
jgi:uncharacterized protein